MLRQPDGFLSMTETRNMRNISSSPKLGEKTDTGLYPHAFHTTKIQANYRGTCNTDWFQLHRRATKTAQNVQIIVLEDRVVFDVEDIASSPFTLYIFDPHPKTYTTDPQSRYTPFWRNETSMIGKNADF